MSTRQAEFLDALSKKRSCLLLMDYDGTIAPFKIIRHEAVPDEKVMSALVELHNSKNCRLVVISGRVLADLISFLSKLSPLPELWGSHGLEYRDTQGQYHLFQLPPGYEAVLESQWDFFKENNLLDCIEKKPFSLAIHWRGKSLLEAESLKQIALERWSLVAGAGDFEICPFNGGLELRIKGIGKEFAINYILSTLDTDIPCVYCGDDLTDEDAFKALGDRGLKVLIRNHPHHTLADVEFASMDQLADFLQECLRRLQL